MSPTRYLAPSSGERRAVRGYAAQYRVAAEIIYDALLEGDLEWVRVADPEAGRIDDVQLARTARLDAYQIKWSEYEGRVTLAELEREVGDASNPTPAPMAQLADGWERLRALYPDRAVHVHYLARSSASTNDSTGGPVSGAHPPHLQAFLRIAFPVRAQWLRAGSTVGADWAEPIERLRQASGLDAHRFAACIPFCHFDLGFRLTDPANDADRTQTRRVADLEDLARYLFNTVADDRGLIQIERSDLLKSLGWERRLDLRFRHDFPVDEHLYRPVRATVAELDTAFRSTRAGYIALVGPPGSGKSTTLTQVLRYRPGCRVVRYYVFVRDDPRQGRGEAAAFLHDLCLSLRDIVQAMAQPRRNRAFPDTRDELLVELGYLLGELHDDWTRSGVATLILVDGLDHIEREQKPIRALFDDLPAPEQVPEGVLFVLGTQPVGLEARSPRIRAIKAHLEESGRTITMARLERRAVYEITATAVPPENLPEGALERIDQLSDGHPLALLYLLGRVAAAEPGGVTTILEGEDPFRGDIEEQYRRYWEAVRGDPAVRDLLGLICRLRGAVNLDVFETLTLSPGVLERFVASARHFFRDETADRWTFFHNSFRLFLLRATSKNALGRDDPRTSASYHAKLAAAAERFPDGSPFSWERLYHLASSGDHAAVLTAFTQDWFRRQFFALRSPDDINIDIGFCLKAAAATDEPLAIVRALLVNHELRERAEALDDVDLPTFLLRLAEPAELSDAAIRGAELLVPVATAFDFAGRLVRGDDPNLAHQLFDAAEPLEVLKGSHLPGRDEMQTLEAWVRVAWLFRPIELILDLLDQIGGRARPRLHLPIEATAPIEDPDQGDGERGDLSVHLAVVLGRELLDRGAMEPLDAVEHRLRQRDTPQAHWALVLLDHRRAQLAADRRLPPDVGEQALQRLLGMLPPADAAPETAIALAEAFIRLHAGREQAEAYLANAPSPWLGGSLDAGPDRNDLQDFMPLLRQARVLAALGSPITPTAIPGAAGERYYGAVLLRRMLIVIGTILGEADAGRQSSPQGVVQRVLPVIRLFRRPFRETRDWLDWYRVEAQAPELFKLVLRAARAHGQDVLDAVFDAFEEDWGNPSPRGSMGWRLAWRQVIVVGAYELDGNTERTARWLERFEGEVDVFHELHERLSHFHELALGWLQLGERERGRRLLTRMLQTSFGFRGRNDDQLERWAVWADRFAMFTLSPNDAAAALLPLIKALPVVHAERRVDDRHSVASQMIETAAALSPTWGCSLVVWLLEQRAASWTTCWEGLLRGCLRAEPASPANAAACLTIAGHFIVPIETQCDTKLAQHLGRAAVMTGTTVPNLQVRSAFERLLRAIATKAFRSDRTSWHTGLADGIRAAGGSPEDWHVAADSTEWPGVASAEKEPPGIALASGEFIPQDVLIERAARPGQFLSLLKNVTEVRGLNWAKVVDTSLCHVRTSYELQELRSALARFDTSLDADVLQARHAHVLGDRVQTAQAMDRLVERSDPRGWYARWDGGTRIMAARCLIDVQGRAGRRRAMSMFVQDYEAVPLHPRDLLRNLDTLLTILFEEEPVGELWAEIAEHVSQIAEVNEAVPAEVPALVAGQNATDALARLTFAQLGHPVQVIADEARKAVLQFMELHITDATLLAALQAHLQSPSDAVQELALSTLTCSPDNMWTNEVAPQVEVLCYSPSAAVGWQAQALMGRTGRVLPPPPRPGPLPSVYGLELPEAAMPDRSLFGDATAPGEALHDTSDMFELARPFSSILDRLAELSGIGVENLAYRLKSLMVELAPSSTWDRRAEQDLQERLNAWELPFAYVRPRPGVGRRAFARVAGELCLAGRVPWLYDPLKFWLVAVDGMLAREDPGTRPAWLEVPSGAEMGTYPRRDWKDHPEECIPRSPRITPDSELVLGELTSFVKHDHGQPTESRASMLADPRLSKSMDERPDDGFFYQRSTFRADDYPRLDGLRVLPTSIIHGGGGPTPSFLALHPHLAAHLGWRLAQEGLFAWVAGAGRPMVRSVWWRDGNPRYADRLGSEGVSAEGWLVLATPEGAEQLRRAIPSFRRRLIAARSTGQGIDAEASVVISHAEEDW